MAVEITGIQNGAEGGASISGWVDFSISVNGALLAKLFWQMEGKQQARFFDALGEIQGREGLAFEAQMAWMQRDLSEGGRRVHRALGEGTGT